MTAAFCLLLGGTVLATSTFATDETDTIYGRGVHAFFDRDYERAIAILSMAEEMGSIDPRPYYFLGLAHLRQNRSAQADQYFVKAAELEYAGRAARDFAVSESLRRIQGAERMRIEQIRTTERANAQQREQRAHEIRYGRENAAAREMLRQPSPQNRRADLAVLQRMAEAFDENAFGARPIDPTDTAERIIITRRPETNPFGEVVTNVDTLPEIMEIRSAARSRGDAGSQTATEANPVLRGLQTEAARGLGRGLGMLFAGRENATNTREANRGSVNIEPDVSSDDVSSDNMADDTPSTDDTDDSDSD